MKPASRRALTSRLTAVCTWASHRQSLNGGPKAVLSGARGRTPKKPVWHAQDAFFEPDALPDGWHAARATH